MGLNFDDCTSRLLFLNFSHATAYLCLSMDHINLSNLESPPKDLYWSLGTPLENSTLGLPSILYPHKKHSHGGPQTLGLRKVTLCKCGKEHVSKAREAKGP